MVIVDIKHNSYLCCVDDNDSSNIRYNLRGKDHGQNIPYFKWHPNPLPYHSTIIIDRTVKETQLHMY